MMMIRIYKVSTPERKRSKSRSDFSLESANADTVGFIKDKPRLRSCVDTHCVSGTNWSEDDKNIKNTLVHNQSNEIY